MLRKLLNLICLVYIKAQFKGYTFHGHVILMYVLLQSRCYNSIQSKEFRQYNSGPRFRYSEDLCRSKCTAYNLKSMS